VGDIVDLEPGNVVPCDGLYLHGHGLACDESSATGESNTIKKQVNGDCFILSGSRVLLGVGRMVVIAVGVHSFFGQTMLLTMSADPQKPDLTPLQQKLNVLADQIAWFGISAAGVIFCVLLAKFFWFAPSAPSTTVAEFIIGSAIEAITIIVVAVPEGLPMAVTLALAYATTQMLKENNLVRVLAACETMGNATTICSDKTGTLTRNKMTVVQGTFAGASFNIDGNDDDDDDGPPTLSPLPLSTKVRQLIKEGVAINSTAYLDDQQGQYVGSNTECALLDMVDQWHSGLASVDEWRRTAVVEQVYPFSSQEKSMAVVIRLPSNAYRLHIKGAPEAILEHCTDSVDEHGALVALDHSFWTNLIKTFAQQGLRTLALAYRDLDDLSGARFESLVLLGVVGIRDPLRPGVVDSVQAFRRAGVAVCMITGDNIYTAKAIATAAGILTTDGLALTGCEFRHMDDATQRATVGHLQVLARSTPHDKMTMVARLQETDEIVGMTGDGTNDGPALKLANIGFSMNVAGSEVAKEASDIILLDDNFNSILKALLWGRSINDGIRKFLTFQLTVNVAAVALALLSAVVSARSESILGAVQLLWINLIMDTLAALALATEPPNDTLLDRPPIPKSDPVITRTMAYRILTQALFQVVVTLLVMYKSPIWFALDSDTDYLVVRTLVFNTFVFLQFFNAINCRRVHDATTLNVFDHLARDWRFLGIQTAIALGQVLIVLFAGKPFKTTRLSPSQWLVSLSIGFASIPMGWLFTLLARIAIACHS
jgi:Ca2+-transporting ATPase